MARYILRFKGFGETPVDDVRQIKAVPGVTIIEETGKMLLLEGPAAQLQTLVSKLPSWVLREERHHQLPGQVPRIKSK